MSKIKDEKIFIKKSNLYKKIITKDLVDYIVKDGIHIFTYKNGQIFKCQGEIVNHNPVSFKKLVVQRKLF